MAHDDAPFLIGYVDQVSYAPGDTVVCRASSSASQLMADVVHLVRARPEAELEGAFGPVVHAITPRVVAAGRQAVPCGSFIEVRDAILGSFEQIMLTLRFWPTRPLGRVQGLATYLDAHNAALITVGLDEAGCPCVLNAQGQILARGRRPVVERRWYALRLEIATDRLKLSMEAVSPLRNEGEADKIETLVSGIETARHLLFAASGLDVALTGQPLGAFDGKLERPTLMSGETCLGQWAFEHSCEGSHVEDMSDRGAHGRTVNAPTRAMTGAGWTGQVEDIRRAGSGHTAIHFHSDDVADARWSPTVEFNLPEDLTSGVYAVRLRTDGGELTDFIPFAVRARQKAEVAFLLPTLTYQAYANLIPPEAPPHPLDPLDQVQLRFPDLGKSTYDSHGDGSGVSLASLARPMLQYRPGYRSWLTNSPRHFSADLFLIEWLDKSGLAFDVVCDHDLHAAPQTVLDGYAVVLTGSHPEYCTDEMLTGLELYSEGRGHLLYLGGNGFYWVTSFASGDPNLVEVRRYGGTRTWDGEPGERYHATTGELGGLWRDRGRAPNRLTGVGMTAQGWDGAAGYRREQASYDPHWSWIFDGVSGEKFGDFGFCLGGASGDELDRYEPRWGSSPDTVLLARSLPHLNGYHAVVEEVIAVEGDLSAASSDRVRSDMVIIERPSGGYTFSVGSISFIGSLMWEEGDNDVSRILTNLLSHWLDEQAETS